MASSSITVLIVLLLALVLVHYPVLMPVLSLAALAAAAACCIRRSVDPSNTCKRPVAQLTTGSVDDCLQEVTATASTAQFFASDEMPLLTPSQIDELTLQQSLAPCDFSHVLDTDFETDWRVVQGECMHNFQFAARGALGTLDVGSPASMADGILLCAGGTITNAALHQMRLMTYYLREFLSKPNPLLGRAGPTCPYMPGALKLDNVHIGVAPSGTTATATEMVRFVRGFIPIYEELAPQTGPTATFKAILLLFPHIPIASAPELIDGTQAALKEQFVSRGLMLGEFHLLNNSPALHNSRFFPLRTVYPALVIRHMVPSDLVFLSADKYPVQRRVAFLQSYVDKMSGQKGAKAQAGVMSARTQLDALSSQ